MRTSASERLHARALELFPGGVNGDGRADAPYPTRMRSAHGSRLVDVDGNEYLDYHGGFGTAVLGYSHPAVTEAVARATTSIGTLVGLAHESEIELAERLIAAIPYAERVALCGGGGSDAMYHAVRLARGVTGRQTILKVEGGYHGWHGDVGGSVRPPLDATRPKDDGLPTTFPNSLGTLASVTAEIVVVAANDPDMLRVAFDRHGSRLAAAIIEPILHSAGCIHVDADYLSLLRELSSRHGVVLIYDEIMTGFRSGFGGAGARLGVDADLAAFGKAVANGYILSFLAGRADLLEQLTPVGPVFYSGTFNSHPLSVAASLATLDVLARDSVPAHLDRLTDRLVAGINEAIAAAGVEAVCQGESSVWCLYFGTSAVRNYADLARSRTPATLALDEAYRHFLRSAGIYLHRRTINRGFISGAHEDADIDRTIGVIADFLREHARIAGVTSGA